MMNKRYSIRRPSPLLWQTGHPSLSLALIIDSLKKRKERKSDLPNRNKIGELETYKAILPLRPLVAELSGSRCRRIGSGGSGKLSPPLTHDAWTTWRHRKRKISSWGVLCKGREHNEQTLFAACMKQNELLNPIIIFLKKGETLTCQEKSTGLVLLQHPWKIRYIAI